MYNSSQKITKIKLEVEIELDGDKRLAGFLFLSPQGRLTDMLNDDRAFLPFETADGRFMVLQKTSFRSVAPVVRDSQRLESRNPYEVLGLKNDATLDAVKQAYRAMSSANHPDRLNGTGLSQDFVDLATSRMTRINDAYKRILKQYEDATPTEVA